MKKAELLKLLNSGREIEFVYSDKEYSITYSYKDSHIDKIHLCEFYKPEQVFDSVEAFLKNAMIGNEKLKSIWEWIVDIVVY